MFTHHDNIMDYNIHNEFKLSTTTREIRNGVLEMFSPKKMI